MRRAAKGANLGRISFAAMAMLCMSGCGRDWREVATTAKVAFDGKPLLLSYQGLKVGLPADSARRLLGSNANCVERGCSTPALSRHDGRLASNMAIFERGVVTSWWADRVVEGAWNADSLRAEFKSKWGKPTDIGPVPQACVDLSERPKATTVGHWKLIDEEAWVFVMSVEGPAAAILNKYGLENYPVLRVALGTTHDTHCWGEYKPTPSERLRP